jgi:hypothetical protein
MNGVTGQSPINALQAASRIDNTPRPTSEVEMAINHLDSLSGAISGRIEVLVGRLSPVVGPDIPANATEKLPEPQTILAQAINRSNNSLASSLRQIENLLARIQL